MLLKWMLFVIKFIFKELKSHPRFTLLFIINASIGLCGFVALDIFKYSLDATLKQHSKSILGADLALSARRPINQKERNIVLQETSSPILESKVVQMYSMISNKNKHTKLVHVKAIQETYPFYGRLVFRKLPPKQQILNQHFHHKPLVWIYPDLLSGLQLKIGDSIHIGNTLFQISGIVEKDPSNNLSTDMAPRV